MPSPSNDDQELPLRQSCDRCHNHKVRCIRSTFSHGTIPSDPCSRCQRAGSTCTYSPQQRPGRPTLNSERRNKPSRKRPRRTPQRFNSPASALTPPCKLEDAELANNALHLDQMGFASTLESDVENHADASFAFKLDFPMVSTIPSIPMAFNISIPSAQDLAVENMVTRAIPNSLDRDVEELAGLNVRICRCAAALSASSRVEHLSLTSPSVDDALASMDALISVIRRHTQDLAQLELLQPESLDFTTWQGMEGTCDQQGVSGQQHPLPTEKTPYPGIMLMIIACHERLIFAFDIICRSIHQRLSGSVPRHSAINMEADGVVGDFGSPLNSNASLSSSSSAQQPYANHYSLPLYAHFRPSFVASTSTQAMLIVELMSHLLQRADQAMRQIRAAPRESRTGDVKDESPVSCSTSPFSSRASSMSASPSVRPFPSIDEGGAAFSDFLNNCQPMSMKDDGGSRCSSSRTIGLQALAAVEHGQGKLRERMKMVRRLLRTLDPIDDAWDGNRQ